MAIKYNNHSCCTHNIVQHALKSIFGLSVITIMLCIINGISSMRYMQFDISQTQTQTFFNLKYTFTSAYYLFAHMLNVVVLFACTACICI